MNHQNPNQEPTFGYLSTVHSAEHGYFGGYLVVSVLGRPLEFHCTAPVLPNRAQEILYGPTLQPYLLGEQIGGTLLDRAKLTPRLILTDQAATLCLRKQFATLMVYLLACEVSPCGSLSPRMTFGEHDLELPRDFESDREAVAELLNKLTRSVDLAEPFDRIHEAIREAQRIGARGPQDAHGQAA